MDVNSMVRGRVMGAATVVVAGLLALVAGCDRGPGERPTPPPPDVGVVELKPQAFDLTSELPGRTAAYRVAEVRPQVSGILQQRLFAEGDTVTVGQVLYQIDPARYQAAVARAEAELARARAATEVARLKAERFAPLVRDGAVPKQDNDDVQAAYRQALAQVQAAQAAVQTARIDLGYTRIDSPIDGVSSESFVTEGALVAAGQAQALTRVTQLDPIYVDIQRPMAGLLRLRRQLAAGHLQQVAPDTVRVTLLLEDGSRYPQPGRLQVSGVTVERDTGSVTLRAVFANPDQLLLPGMYVRAQLNEGTQPDALLVPQRAVTYDAAGQANALVVNDENKLERREVETQVAVGGTWLVNSGLAAGDRVVVSGPLRLVPGMAVNPVPVGDGAAVKAPDHG